MMPSTQSSGTVVVQLFMAVMLCSGDQTKSLPSFLPVAGSDLAQPVGNHEDVLKFANMMSVHLSL